MPLSPGEVTKLLGEVRLGNREAESQLAAAVQVELRAIAARLQATRWEDLRAHGLSA